jgi:hypothetical protein
MIVDILFCSRVSPTLFTARLEVTALNDLCLNAGFSLDISGLPLRQLLRLKPNTDCDGAMRVEGRGGLSTVGIALLLAAEDSRFQPNNGFLWGYENERVTHDAHGNLLRLTAPRLDLL